MAKKPKHANPVIQSSAASIGHLSAESDDEFLFDCFIYNPAYNELHDFKSARTILSGRTGSGKTAILRQIVASSRNVTEVDLLDLSLNYIANSDIIRFVAELGINLDIMFQTLWRHVLCIEFIRLKYNVRDSGASKNLLMRLVERFQADERRKKAIAYLQEWGDQFWITMDENIKEFTQKVEGKISTEFGAEIEKFTARAGYARTLSSEKRAEFVARVKKIIDAQQLSDLSRVLDLLSEEDDGPSQRNYYILIDKLDENWVDERIRYGLIAALVETIKTFQKIRSLKVVVAIRTDVIERVVQSNKDIGFQREKFDDYFFRISWTQSQLKDLVDKRISSLYKRKYTSENVTFDDLFTYKIDTKDPFDYIIERTLMRPRDVVSFVNYILKSAEGFGEVHPKHMKSAEKEFSRIRKQALIDEWRGALPSLTAMLDIFTNGKASVSFDELLKSSKVDEAILQISSMTDCSHDPIVKRCADFMKNEGGSNTYNISQAMIAELYRIGAVGVKVNASEKFSYSFRDDPVMQESLISLASKVSVVNMLHSSLNVR